MNPSERIRLQEGVRYWQERCREDPRAWTKHALRFLGFSEEEIDRIERERVFLDADKGRREGERFLQRIRGSNRRLDRQIRQLNIEITQGIRRLEQQTRIE